MSLIVKIGTLILNNIIGIIQNRKFLKMLANNYSSLKNIIIHLLLFLGFISFVSAQNCPNHIIFNRQSQIDSFPIIYPNCNLVGSITISSKDVNKINNLIGLNSIDTIEDYLLIENNPELLSLDGLESLQYLGSIYLQNNLNLTSINAIKLSSIKPAWGSIWILRNPNLNECSIKPICDYLEANSHYNIAFNGDGCNNKREILTLCNIPDDPSICPDYLTTSFENWDEHNDTLYLADWEMSTSDVFENFGLLSVERTQSLTEGDYSLTIRGVNSNYAGWPLDFKISKVTRY